ncbi:uncharacterized protein G2W53_003016 [Senna tora]|uniref:Uncharacterized protein n=1 Tax=Senna tora TaxID=362788 RepID=A0A834XBX1_9FABA|nr:uncharacterized protein G2W53_003016 [Senna tora]
MLGGRSRGEGEGEGGIGFAKALEYLHLILQPRWSSRWTARKLVEETLKVADRPGKRSIS